MNKATLFDSAFTSKDAIRAFSVLDIPTLIGYANADPVNCYGKAARFIALYVLRHRYGIWDAGKAWNARNARRLAKVHKGIENPYN